MANNRIYANFLMHGRTKGSRNGVSTTKGYTAVGQKAKGKIINGRYVYDYYTPYGTKNSSITEGYTPLAAISTTEQKRQEQREKDDYKARLNKSMAKTAARVKSENAAKKGAENNWQQQANQAASYTGYKTLSYKDRQNKMKAENAARVKAENYATKKKYGYKEMGKQAASQEWRDKQERAESEAKKKMYSQAANAEHDTLARRNSVAKGAANNWQQQAAYQQQKEAARNRATATAAKGASNDWQSKANAARAMTEYGRKTETARNAKYAKEKVKSVLDRDSLSGKTHGHMNVDPSKSLVSNQWQRYGEEARTRKQYGDSSVGHKTFEQQQADTTKKYLSQEKMKSKQPNAMQGDARYTTKENAMKGDPRYTSNKPGPLFTSRDPKYGYSGKNDPRAPVFKEITMIDMYGNKTGGKETPMNRDPYFESWSKATNKQESAKAQAGNKAFMNAFEESKKRNSRSDIGNAVADFKEEAKAKAKSLFKKKKKKK